LRARARHLFSGIGIYLPETENVESAVARGLYPADEVATRGFSGATGTPLFRRWECWAQNGTSLNSLNTAILIG
jgi:hypothetical protein